MPKAPLPSEMPGQFFVMEWSRDSQTYVIHVDDEQASSYALGSDYTIPRQLFRAWGMPDIGARAFDMAREFGVVQAIPDQDRVFALMDRNKDVPLDWSRKGRNHALPTLTDL